jgi:serine/threonine protein kinase
MQLLLYTLEIVTRIQEAENLLFLEANSKVRAPKVFAVFSHHGEHPLGWFKGHEITFHYLVMEYLPGNPLTSERFKSYDSTTQRIIGSKIAEQLKQLREVEQLESSPYYGRINKQGWSRDFRMFVCPGRTTCRPYESYREFIDAMFYCARYCAATGPSNFQEPFRGGTKFTLANFRHSLMGVAEEDQRPTLTHLDLKFENILVQETGDDYVVTLIDWEYCGWMPAWIEGVTAMSRPLVYDITERRNLTWEISQGIQPLNLAAARFLVSCFEDLQYCLV